MSDQDDIPDRDKRLLHESGILSSKTPTTIGFALCVLLFLLPFLNLKNEKGYRQDITGLQLVTGFIINLPAEDKGNEGFGERRFRNVVLSEARESNVYALIALGLGIMGCFLSWVNARPDGIGGVLAGALSAAALLIYLLTSAKTTTVGVAQSEIGSGAEILAMKFSPWYYLVIVLFTLAAFFSYKRIRLNR